MLTTGSCSASKLLSRPSLKSSSNSPLGPQNKPLRGEHAAIARLLCFNEVQRSVTIRQTPYGARVHTNSANLEARSPERPGAPHDLPRPDLHRSSDPGPHHSHAALQPLLRLLQRV